MRCLITGCSGLIGPHLAEYLLTSGDDVAGTYFSSTPLSSEHTGHVKWVRCDVSNATDVERTIGECDPDRIFHLAAQSYPLKSWSNPGGTLAANVTGTLNLLEAVRKSARPRRILVFGSSAEYGNTAAQVAAIAETAVLRPDSPYGVSKVAADLLADVYTRAYHLDLVQVRPFFVIGPGRGSNVFVDFAKRIVNLENGDSEGLGVGNLDAERDLIDVRDAVRAIGIIAERSTSGAVYNLCTGEAHTIREALDILLKHCRKPIRVFTDPGKFRPLDTPRLVGDSSKLRQLGWAPSIPLEQTLVDILSFWRAEAMHFASSAD